MITEPLVAVGRDSLDFDKVGGRMPAVVVNRHEGAWSKPRLTYFTCSHPVDRYPNISYKAPLMVDCDGDALLIVGWMDSETEEFQKTGFSREVAKNDLNDLNWRDTGITADYHCLMTTILVDTKGFPLGVGYSSIISAAENFKPKRITGNGSREGPYNIVTLRSRKRGIWAKGLKNPNDDPDAPLPEELGLSSNGSYLFFRNMRTNQDGTALMLEAEVPENHGFCHHKYKLDPDSEFHFYPDGKRAPADAKPYRSCFHRVYVPVDI